MKEIINCYRKIAEEKSSQPISIKRKEFRELINYISILEAANKECSHALILGEELAQSVKVNANFNYD